MSEEVNSNEQETALEKERRIKAGFEYKTEKLRQEHRDLVESNKRERFAEQFARQLAATNLQFHGDLHELRTVVEAKGAKFIVRNDGAFTLQRDSKEVDFATEMEDFAVRHPFLLKNREAIAHRTTAPEQLCKADFATNAAKIKLIEERGLQFWENLPATKQDVVLRENLTIEQYRNASIRQKLAWNLTEEEIALLGHTGRLPNAKKR